ncbi:MAG: hypothetical protein GY809_07580 [Planctomycetes bacterium]|nr:hypothetical protein [Planctomycetota bacterium]
MIELSCHAQNTLDQYLRQVHAYLRGSASVDAGDVEQSIHEHVETELAHASEPVTAEQFTDVLRRLGSPRQWVPEEELPWWRRMILHWQVGPDDWRLAYLSFVLLFVGLAGLFAGSPICVLILASVLVSRAALSAAGESDLSKGQKWLLYPGLATVYLPVASTVLFWPPTILSVVAIDIDHFPGLYRWWSEMYGSPHGGYYLVTATAFVTCVTALWWILVGFVTLIWLKWIKVLFYPFAESASRGKVGGCIVIAFMIFMLGIGVTWYYLAAPLPG